jgi:hypothetical protein
MTDISSRRACRSKRAGHDYICVINQIPGPLSDEDRAGAQRAVEGMAAVLQRQADDLGAIGGASGPCLGGATRRR